MNVEPSGNGFRKQALRRALFGPEVAIEPYNVEGRVFQHLRPAVRVSRTTG